MRLTVILLFALVVLVSGKNMTGNINVTQFTSLIEAAENKSTNVSVVAKYIGDLLDIDKGVTWNVIIRQRGVIDSSFALYSLQDHYLNW